MSSANPNMTNVDENEIAKFDSLAARWWDSEGDFKTLHDINPARLNYIDRRAGIGLAIAALHGGLATAPVQEQPVPARPQSPQKGSGERSQLAPSKPLAAPPTLCTLRIRLSLPPSPLGQASGGGSERLCSTSMVRLQESHSYS